jgi:putative ATPase
MDLFRSASKKNTSSTPLAERMRPRSFEEFVGQEHLLGPGKVLKKMAEEGRVPSLLFWGPPGCGKTTLARVLAESTKSIFFSFSAVLAGVREIRQVTEKAQLEKDYHGRQTVLFVDEIHRFNKAQQDALLPHVESGTITLIGATTENPSFEVVAPLLSRVKVVVLEPLTTEQIQTVVERALNDRERGLGSLDLAMPSEAIAALAVQSVGDARIALNTLEIAAGLAAKGGGRIVDLKILKEALQHRGLLYDQKGEEHYNAISAFIKSLRGSDPDAAIYWMLRMIEAGEDPLFLARRMIIFAAEDIGNADPQALQIAVAAKEAFHFVGLPEGKIPLSQAAIYLASAPKSNAAYRAMQEAEKDIQERGALPVPLHLRNAPTGLMEKLGYGKGYAYPHNFEGHTVFQRYFPNELGERKYYFPSDEGKEKEIKVRLELFQELKRESKVTLEQSESDPLPREHKEKIGRSQR